MAFNETSSDDQDGDQDRPLELPILHRPPRQHGSSIAGRSDTKQRPADAPSTSFDNKPRDPRFDPRCNGSSDLRHFVRNYNFLDDIRKTELNELERALRREKDSEKRQKIKLTINRIKNKMVETQNKMKKNEVVDSLKQSVAKGKKFKNIRKSDLKKSLIVNKFKELKESGKLNKYLERKRKKLIQRDGRAFDSL